MKIFRRIVVILPFIFITFWLLQHLNDEENPHYFYIIFLIFIIGYAWMTGGQFEKAKSYRQELMKNKEELKKNKEELQQIFDSVDATIWSDDVVNKKMYVSKGIERLTGYSIDQFYSDYRFWQHIIYEEDQQKGSEFLENTFNGYPSHIDLRLVHASGKLLWVHIAASPVFNKDGKKVGKINGVVIDISELKKTEAMLQQSEARYRNVLEISPNLVIIHQHHTIVYANPSAAKILGEDTPSDLLGKSIFEYLHPSQQLTALYRIREILRDKPLSESEEYKLIRIDGKFVYLEVFGSKINYQDKPAILVIGNDITVNKKYQERISYMAYHDALTDLPNRHMYNEMLGKAMMQCKQRKQELAVLLLDLDRFKFINDTLGHQAGDQLLTQVAERLVKSVRKEDMVFRQGGDEFIILLVNIDKKMVHNIANNIIKSFSSPFMIADKSVYTTPSIGISLFPKDGEDMETLNKKADIAMYSAKNKGKNNYQFYLHEREELLDRKNNIERDLRKAINNEEFYLLYQPKVDMRTGRMTGVEALVRWKHPELGLIFPNEFIPIAEQSGLIIKLGNWVLQQACKQNSQWVKLGLQLKISVNVSPLQFDECDFIGSIERGLRKNDLPPDTLIIEITEGVTQNINKTAPILQKLKKMGVKIAIDDFGTGYSSLSVLSSLTIDYLKIDRSFINAMLTNANTTSLVKTIIEMGRNLSFELIAEGIETKQQALHLLEHDCYYGQGYLYSPPVSAKEIESIWNKGAFGTLS